MIHLKLNSSHGHERHGKLICCKCGMNRKNSSPRVESITFCTPARSSTSTVTLFCVREVTAVCIWTCDIIIFVVSFDLTECNKALLLREKTSSPRIWKIWRMEEQQASWQDFGNRYQIVLNELFVLFKRVYLFNCVCCRLAIHGEKSWCYLGLNCGILKLF